MLNTARIAQNTIFLYLRMILVLAANFLAVRVLLVGNFQQAFNPPRRVPLLICRVQLNLEKVR